MKDYIIFENEKLNNLILQPLKLFKIYLIYFHNKNHLIFIINIQQLIVKNTIINIKK